MGNYTGARSAYTAVVDRAARDQSATHRAEAEVRQTRVLNPLVDPGANNWGKSRRSLIRFNPLPDGRFEVAVGLSVPIKIDLDTTGSMGRNVDIALRRIPDTRDLLQDVMRPGCEAHVATGVFNDVQDKFDDRSPGIVLTRSQYEMTEKMAEQMTHHIPMRNGGGNGKEDSQFAFFAEAYLSSFYINRIDLKSYHFVITDDAAASYIDKSQLIRIFGADVFDAVNANGHEMDPNNLPSTHEVMQSLLKRSYAFVLLVNPNIPVMHYWAELMGPERVVTIPTAELVSEIIATIVGLTEGTLELSSVEVFLKERGVSSSDAQSVARSVRNIPIGAQTVLENFNNIPVRGDIFETKEALWPIIRASERDDFEVDAAPEEVGGWL